MGRSLLAVATILAVAVLTSCGGGGDSDGGGGRLSDALGSVSTGPAAQQAFLWTDVAAVRKTGDFPDHIADLKAGDAQRTWLIPLGTGAARLITYGIPVAETLGIDVLSADQAITIGNPPQSAVRLDGVDAQAAHDALVKNAGARPGKLGDRSILTRGAEGQVDVSDESSQALIGIGNRLFAEDDTVALSGNDASLQAVLGDGDKALSDVPAYAAAADCLGDVLSAELHPGSVARADADVVAIGVRGGSVPTEVLCAVGDEGQAKAISAALQKHMTPDAITPDTRQPLGDIVSKTDVDSGAADGEHYARAVLTLADGRPAGFLAQALQRRALAGYLGG